MIKTGYPINRFAHIGYKGFSRSYPTNSEKFQLNITQNEKFSTAATNNQEDINPPIPPQKADYLKEVTYSDGLKETLVDEFAYNNAIENYKIQKAEYNKKIIEQNEQTSQQQKEDIINSIDEELNSFNQSVQELQSELDSNGTNSKMMTSIINNLSAEYTELLQEKKEEEIKNVDNFMQNLNNTIPNPPSKSFYETDEEYADALNLYTYQQFLYERQNKISEIKTQIYKMRIQNINKKLEEIRNLLFGSAT